MAQSEDDNWIPFPVVHLLRGGDTSMAGMAIALPGVLNNSKTGDTMGKIRWHRGKKRKKMAKNLSNGQKNRCPQSLPSLPNWGNAAPALTLFWLEESVYYTLYKLYLLLDWEVYQEEALNHYGLEKKERKGQQIASWYRPPLIDCRPHLLCNILPAELPMAATHANTICNLVHRNVLQLELIVSLGYGGGGEGFCKICCNVFKLCPSHIYCGVEVELWKSLVDVH